MKYTASFDGGINPTTDGFSTYGAIVYKGGMLILHKGGVAMEGEGATVNIAEYHGLLEVLDCLIDNMLAGDEALVKGDSQLIIYQVMGKWKCKATNLQPFWRIARNKMSELRHRQAKINLEWNPREMNTDADKLATAAYEKVKVKCKGCISSKKSKQGVLVLGLCHLCGKPSDYYD